MNIIPQSALGAVLAAMIAGLITLLGLIISKEQKISDFRQAWIDALRNDVSSLIAHTNVMHGHLTIFRKDAEDRWLKASSDYVGANRSAASIRLRLNPLEKQSKIIFDLIECLEKEFAPGKVPSQLEIDRVEKRLVIETQILLKREWQRVSSGELVFQIARAVSFSLLLSGFCLLLFIVFSGWR